MQANRNIRIVFFLCIAIALGMSLWIQAQELLPVSVHTAALRQSATPFSLFSENYSADLAASSVYVGSELCLACHSSFTPEAAGWHETKHAYFIRKPMGLYSLQAGKGVMANMLGKEKDDFINGLDFNKLSGTVMDSLKPNAPILSYHAATDTYSIQLGPDGLKMPVVATLGGASIGNGQRYMVRVPVADLAAGLSDAIYFSPLAWSGTAWTSNASNWYDGNTPKFPVGITSSALVPLQSQNYMKTCSGCHITGVRKAYVSKSGEYVVNPYVAVLVPDDSPNYPDLDGDGNADMANIGCESCHGPGSGHIMRPSDSSRIVNPSKMTNNQQRSVVCLQCHVQIASSPNKTWGFTYNETTNQPYVLTNPPQSLDAYQVFTGGKWPDGWNYVYARIDSYRESGHYKGAHGIACNNCHFSHGETTNPAQVRSTITDSRTGLVIPASTATDSFCLACHAGYGVFSGLTKQMVKDWNSNFSTTIRPVIEAHTRHPYGADRKMGLSNCIGCHMAPTSGRGVVEGATHTFMPARPQDTIAYQNAASTGTTYGAAGNVNSCSSACHRGKAILWSEIPANLTPSSSKFNTSNEIELAKKLLQYYGPEGTWWKTAQ